MKSQGPPAPNPEDLLWAAWWVGTATAAALDVWGLGPAEPGGTAALWNLRLTALALAAAPGLLTGLGAWLAARALGGANPARRWARAVSGLGGLVVGPFVAALLGGYYVLGVQFAAREFKNAEFAAFVQAVLQVAWLGGAGTVAWLAATGLARWEARLRGGAMRRILGGALPVAAGVVAAAAPVIWLVSRAFAEEFEIVAAGHGPGLRYAASFGLAAPVAWAGLQALPGAWAGVAARYGGRFGAAASVFIVTRIALLGAQDAAIPGGLTGSPGVAGTVLTALAALSDGDGDGFGARFGGADCDDTRARVYPGAAEIAGNGVDDDCDGIELALAEPARAGADLEAAHPVRAREAFRDFSVLWILIDTLRADHTGPYGYARSVTPRIDELARRGTVFERNYAQGPMSKMSIPPTLCGRYGSEIAYDFAPFWPRLRDENVTAGEILTPLGYHTGLIAAHWYFLPRFNQNQGYATWDLRAVTPNGESMEGHITSPKVTEAGMEFLEARARDGQKFVLVWHTIDPHHLYFKHAGHPDFGDADVDRYDAEIHFTDAHVGKLVDGLERTGLAPRTLVIVSSDHGEAFGERGVRYHGQHLHDELVRTPLVIALPGATPSRVSFPVSNLDILPTILDLAGSPGAQHLPGYSLLPYLLGEDPGPRPPVLLEKIPDKRHTFHRGLVAGDWKLIHRITENDWQLFNLAADPGERRNVVAAEPERFRHMRAELAKITAGMRLPAVRHWVGQPGAGPGP